jgi:enamine deaminase RidA (YjgF/YER057c/UK114 family)
MSKVQGRLAELGLELPEPLRLPPRNQSTTVLAGELLYVCGHPAGFVQDPAIKKRGKVGLDVSEKEAYDAARACALMMLATVQEAIGDLDRVRRVVKILGMVNAHPDFEHHHRVIDGATELFHEVFGPEVGKHARSSFGVASLVRRQPVEIEGVFHIHLS